MNKAILFLVFNRLDYVQKSFFTIKEAKPPRLYISSDAARPEVDGEIEKVERVRSWILQNVDWNCSVYERFNVVNEGSAQLNNAITWFFEQEKDGIIMEDDVLPCKSFFPFCESLLDRYESNKNIWNISGQQFFPNHKSVASYYFGFPDMCAWATWADRWKYFENNLANYDEGCVKQFLFKQNKNVIELWISILNSIKSGTVDDWDYKWTFTIIKYNGLSINPVKNLSTNFGVVGTHFENTIDSPVLNVPTYEIETLIHPSKIRLNQYCMAKTFEIAFGVKRMTIRKFIRLKIVKVKEILKNVKIKYLR